MVEIIIQENNILKNLMSFLKNVNDEECIFIINKDGILFSAFDFGKSSYYKVLIPRSGCVKYIFENLISGSFSVPILDAIIKRMNHEDKLTITYHTNYEIMLSIGEFRNFSINFSKQDLNQIVDPIEFKILNSAKLDKDIFADLMKDVNIFSESFQIRWKENELICSAFSFKGKYSNRLRISSDVFGEEIKREFQSKHFLHLLPLLSASDQFNLEISDGGLLKCILETKSIIIQYIITPNVR